MAIARVAGPHAASEVRIHPLRRSAPLSAPSAPPCCSAAHLSHLRLVALPQRSTEETREQKRSRAVGGMLRGVKHAHEHVVESLEVADPVRLNDRRIAPAVACPTVEVAREVGAGAHSRTARALREEGLVDSVRDVRRRDQLGKEVRHILALAVYNITYNINLKYD